MVAMLVKKQVLFWEVFWNAKWNTLKNNEGALEHPFLVSAVSFPSEIIPKCLIQQMGSQNYNGLKPLCVVFICPRLKDYLKVGAIF